VPEKDALRIREGILFLRDGSSNVPGETRRLNCSDGRRVCGETCGPARGREEEGAEELVDSVGEESPTICVKGIITLCLSPASRASTIK
jgi:hypothetical protein